MLKLIFASNNENKYIELKRIIRETGYEDKFELLNLKEVGLDIDVKETYDTLEENAIKKAKVAYKKIKNKIKDYVVISEDFGFFIEEYPEVAGVHSNKWLKGTDDDRNKEVVRLMKNIENRNCYYKSVFAIYDGEIERVFSGYTYGTVSEELRGTNGFAYDKIFKLENNKTIAELEPEEKDTISSRREAFEYLLKNIISE